MLLSMPRSWKLLLACLLAVGLFLPATTSAQAASATVSGVKVTDGTGTLKVDVQATAPVQYRMSRFSEPRQMVVIDVWPAVLGSTARPQTSVNRGLVEGVRLVQHSQQTVRVYLDVISQPELQISPAPERRGVAIAVSTRMAEAKATTAPAPQSSAVVRPAPVQRPVAVAPAPAPVRRPVAQAAKKPVPVASARPTSTASALRAQRPKPRPAPPRKTVSMDFVDEDLVYVIKALAQEMGRNVFVATDVEGTVTVTLNKVEPEGALALVLKMNDYAYKIVDNTIVVATEEKLATIADDILTPRTRSTVKRTNLISQEFQLESATAAVVMEFLKKQYPDVEFTQHPTLNGFFAKGTRNELRQIKGSLPSLDQVPAAAPPPRREFIPVNYGEGGKVLELVGKFVTDATCTLDDRLGVLIVEGSDEAIGQVRDLLAEIDKPKRQVMLDVKVVDLTESGSKSLGVTWGSVDSVGTFSTTFSEMIRDITTGQIDTQGQTASLAIGSFARAPFIVKTTLAFLVGNGEGKILASPRVATQSGEAAELHIGDKYPIVYYDSRAGQFQVTYVDIGVKMSVEPEVKADGYIVAKVQPSVSNMVGLVNGQYPWTTERSVDSTMRVKDGDTIVLGGLISENQVHDVSKVPLLGDLPIFGTFFRSISDKTTRNEVVLMMTPHIMD